MCIRDSAQTLRLEDDLNVELEFVYYPSTAEEFIQKVELQIMAGGDELPDIIMSDLGGLNNLAMYGQMGIILPVTEYYDTIAYYTDQNMEANGLNKEDLLRYITAYDGEIYGLMRYHAYINNSLSDVYKRQGMGFAAIVPSVLMINTRLWFVYPLCYPLYWANWERGQLAAGSNAAPLPLLPWLPLAAGIAIWCLGIACLRYGAAERE